MLLHKLDSSQEVVLQKLDASKKDLELMRALRKIVCGDFPKVGVGFYNKDHCILASIMGPPYILPNGDFQTEGPPDLLSGPSVSEIPLLTSHLELEAPLNSFLQAIQQLDVVPFLGVYPSDL